MNNQVDQNGKSQSSFRNLFPVILILIGIILRVLMLFYFYAIHIFDPGRSWNDLGAYFTKNLTSPPLTIGFLEIFRFLSFGSIYLFAFWGFFWDLMICILFYFVLKSFKIKNIKYAYGLFLINPFYFLKNVFSIDTCGYHITDAFFLFLLLLALYFYPKTDNISLYLFYLFLGLSICSKYYTLPAVAFLFFKFLLEKNWKELKILMSTTVLTIIIFIIIPLFITDWFFDVLFKWSSTGLDIPLPIKLIPLGIAAVLYLILRIKKARPFEIIFFSVFITGLYMIFSYPYLRWFQSILFYGILTESVIYFFNIKIGKLNKTITINNHNMTFLLSIVGVIGSFILISLNLI
ncbi:MAG: hypothetical protein GF317_08160 [Candidatus Lokiarchaeota archaeon]|nr:hypothetical protein [Candidatus Lokiarchaeota archaeon]MBD3199684.1 hypothetical protein [Candidatus Lokiarchaeota archaeon]